MYNNPYGPYGMPYGNFQQQPQPQMTQQPKTNKILVTGLSDALNRLADPNSVMIYIDQDKPFIYQIKTDIYGKKEYETFSLQSYTTPDNPQEPKADLSNYVTKQEFQAVLAKIEALMGSKGELD